MKNSLYSNIPMQFKLIEKFIRLLKVEKEPNMNLIDKVSFCHDLIKGMYYISIKRYYKALFLLEDIVKKDSSQEIPQYFLSHLYLKLSLYDDARKQVQNAKKVSSNLYTYNILEGFINRYFAHYDKALMNFQIAYDLNPQDQISIHFLALTYRKLGNLQQTIDVYKQHALKYGSDYMLLFNLSEVYRESGNLNEAIHSAILALKKLPEKNRHYLQLANLLIHKKRINFAKKILKVEELRFPQNLISRMSIITLYLEHFFIHSSNNSYRDLSIVELSTLKSELKIPFLTKMCLSILQYGLLGLKFAEKMKRKIFKFGYMAFENTSAEQNEDLRGCATFLRDFIVNIIVLIIFCPIIILIFFIEKSNYSNTKLIAEIFYPIILFFFNNSFFLFFYLSTFYINMLYDFFYWVYI